MNQLPPEIQDILYDRLGEDGKRRIDIVFVLRGLPGSGKSTLARNLLHYCGLSGRPGKICSADEWFYVDGQYNWHSSGLRQAHEYSQGQFALAMLKKYQVIVVDNTNLKIEHFEWYVEMARQKHYKVVVIEWRPGCEDEAIAMTRRSWHVPLEYDAWSIYRGVWERWTTRHNDGVQLVTLTVLFEDPRAPTYRSYDGRGYVDAESSLNQVLRPGRGVAYDFHVRKR